MLFVILFSMLFSVVHGEQARPDLRFPDALSANACEKHCTDLNGCREWNFDEKKGCYMLLETHVFVEGAQSGISLLQDCAPFTVDPECGLQYNTVMIGDCTYEVQEGQCMGACSEGCEYVRGACHAECRPASTRIAEDDRPNILFIFVDDWGWKDIGEYHDAEFDLENVQRLVESGIFLSNYYTNSFCSPTRASLLTGRQDIETGLQTGVIFPATTAGIPQNFETLPEILRDELGYQTHAVGKWHLGASQTSQMPLGEGFQTFFGFMGDRVEYFEYQESDTTVMLFTECDGESFFPIPFEIWGNDIWDGYTPVPLNEVTGTYVTDQWNSKTIEIIEDHNPEQGPFFIYLAHSAAHNPWEAPYSLIYDDGRCDNVIDDTVQGEEENRRILCAMLHSLDDGLGDILDKLQETGLLQDTLIVISTDNGAQADLLAPDEPTLTPGGSNAPLRAGKATFFEGALHGNCIVWGNPVRPGTVDGSGNFNTDIAEEIDILFHVSDWFLTLRAAAGDPGVINVMQTDPENDADSANDDVPPVDTSFNLWHALLSGSEIVKRTQMYLGMSWPRDEDTTGAVRDEKYKLYVNPNQVRADGWFDKANPGNDEVICGPLLGAPSCLVTNPDVLFFNIDEDPEERNPIISGTDQEGLLVQGSEDEIHYNDLWDYFNIWKESMVESQYPNGATRIAYHAEGFSQFWDCYWAPFVENDDPNNPGLPDFSEATRTGECTDDPIQNPDCGSLDDLNWRDWAVNQ